jgi:hypothetical protein
MGCLYAALLGPAWEAVDERLCRFHDRGLSGAGLCRVEWGSGRGMGWLARRLGLPAAGEEVPVDLAVRREGEGEVWERRFGGGAVRSIQRLAGDRMAERFGPVEVLLRPVVEDGAIRFATTGAALCLGRLRLPLPRWAGPAVEAREAPAALPETVHFAVRVTLFRRALLAYEGDLRLAEAA